MPLGAERHRRVCRRGHAENKKVLSRARELRFESRIQMRGIVREARYRPLIVCRVKVLSLCSWAMLWDDISRQQCVTHSTQYVASFFFSANALVARPRRRISDSAELQAGRVAFLWIARIHSSLCLVDALAPLRVSKRRIAQTGHRSLSRRFQCEKPFLVQPCNRKCQLQVRRYRLYRIQEEHLALCYSS